MIAYKSYSSPSSHIWRGSLVINGYALVADYEFANQWFEILDYELKFKTTHNIF